jgi:cell division protein FtsW
MVLSASSVSRCASTGSSWSTSCARPCGWPWAVVVAWPSCGSTTASGAVFGPPLLGVTVVLLVLVLIPGVGINVNGSSRWLGAGPIRIQPSELAKLAMLLFVADLLARRADRIDRAPPHPQTGHHRHRLHRPHHAAAEPGHHHGHGASCSRAVRGRRAAGAAGGGGVAGIALAGVTLALGADYRRSGCSPSSTRGPIPSTPGTRRSSPWYAIAEGGISGVGLGASRAKWGFLPNAHTDFIFAIIGEEPGSRRPHRARPLRRLRLARRARRAARPGPLRHAARRRRHRLDPAQAFVNIGAVIGILPITGVPLPFVSFGGSSLLVTMAGPACCSTSPARPDDPPRLGAVSSDAPETARSAAGAPTWLIAGGGTGGHVLPGIAIARERSSPAGHPRTIHFVGSERGIENATSSHRRVPLTVLPGRGIQRRPRSRTSARSSGPWCGRSSAALRLVGGARPSSWRSAATPACRRRLRRHLAGAARGGRAERPGRRREPPGRHGSPRPARCLPRARPAPGHRHRQPGPARRPRPIVPTGRGAAGRDWGADRTGALVAFGGSLGARRINEASSSAVGPTGGTAATSPCTTSSAPRLGLDSGPGPARRGAASPTAVEYEDRHAHLLAAADVAVCRAGGDRRRAGGRRGARGPGAAAHRARDHQTANAAALVDAGAAVLVPDGELDGARLAAELAPLLARPGRSSGHGRGGPLGRPDAADGSPTWSRSTPDEPGRRPGSRSTSTRSRGTIHVVGVGGAGMSAIAVGAGGMGHRVSGSDLKDSPGLDRWPGDGRHGAVGHDASNVGDVDAVACPPPCPPTIPRSSRPDRRGHPGAAPGRDPRRHRPAPADRRGGRHPRQDDDVVDARARARRGAGLAPVLHHRWRDQRDRHRRGVGRGDLVRRRGRRERRHVPRARGRGRRGHQRRTRPPRALRRLRRLVAAFERFVAGAPDPRCCAPTTRDAARAGARSRAPCSPTARAAGATTASSGVRRRPDRHPSFASARPVGTLDRPRAPRPRGPQRPQRRRARGRGECARGPSARRSAGLAAYGGWPTLRVPRRGRRGHLGRRLRPPAHRGRRRPRRRADGGVGPGRVRVPAPPLQPHRRSLWGRRSPTRSTAADVVVVTDVYGAGERPRPGATGKRIARRRPRRRTPRPSGLPTPSATTSSPPAAELRPGDLCLTLGAGDLSARRRRPGGRVGGRAILDRAWTGPTPGPSPGRRRGARSTAPARRHRSGPLTTYRVGARRRCWSSPTIRSATSPRWPAATEPSGPRCWSWARGSNLLVVDAGLPRDRRGPGRGVRGHRDPRGLACGPAARQRCPSWPGARVAAGLTGFEWAVGVPGSIGGAVRMNAAGTARTWPPRSGASASSTSLTGDDGARARGRVGPRLPPLQPPRPPRRGRGELELAPGDPSRRSASSPRSSAGGARTSPAGRTRARCSPTPKATHAGRLIDAAGLRGCAIGSATVSTKHANFIQAETRPAWTCGPRPGSCRPRPGVWLYLE